MSFIRGPFEPRQSLLIVIAAWLLISTTQTFHFYFYFDQSLWDSIRWSFRDWFVWFVLFACIYKVAAVYSELSVLSLRAFILVTLIAVFSGFIQVLAIVSLDFIAGTASRPFWDDFLHFYNKRWFQYLFVFVIFWLLMLNRLPTKGGQADQSAEDTDNRIQLHDGKQTHWLNTSDITSVEAAGNYLCIHTHEGEIVIRGTLKDIEEKLSESIFLRISRSNLVNRETIKSCQRVSRSKVELELIDGSVINVGPTYWAKVKEALNL